MDFDDFRLFEEVALSLHFRRAARTLGLSPSALTRRVQALEEELGTPLLQRDQRTVTLTAAGEQFRTFARAEQERLEQLKNELTHDADSPHGELHIACTVTACHSVLPRLLAECRNRYPRIALQLITQDAERSLAQLEAGEVDLAVIPTDTVTPARLHACVLGKTDLVFIGPPDEQGMDAIAPNLAKALRKSTRPLPSSLLQSCLADVPLVVPVGGLERSRLNTWLRHHHIDARIVAEVRGNEGIIAMISLGSGIGIVPHLVLNASPLRVTPLPGIVPPPGYYVSLCARPKSLTRDAVRAVFELGRILGK